MSRTDITPRTSSQKWAMDPIKVRFGQTDYELACPSANKSRQWRETLRKTLMEVSTRLHTPQGSTIEETIADCLGVTLLEMSDSMMDLIFAFDPALPKDKILDEASDEQLQLTIQSIMEVVFVGFLEIRQLATQALAALK